MFSELMSHSATHGPAPKHFVHCLGSIAEMNTSATSTFSWPQVRINETAVPISSIS